MTTYEMFRGDTFSLSLDFTNGDGTIVDITGWALWLTVKSPADDLATVQPDEGLNVKFQQKFTTHISPTQGLAVLTIPAAVSFNWLGRYDMDVQMVQPEGTVTTLVCALLNVIRDITRKVS